MREALRNKDNECAELIEQLRNVAEGIRESERKMEERMLAMKELVRSKVGDFGGAIGGENMIMIYTLGMGKCKMEKGLVGSGGETRVEMEEEKKKKTSQNRRHERLLKMKKGWSIDSLYSSAEEQGEGSEDEGTEDDSLEGIFNVKRSILIRDISRPGKYDLYGAKDVVEFFRELYERVVSDTSQPWFMVRRCDH